MIAFTCKTQRDTEQLGARFVKTLEAPCLVALYGGLGAGKTAFVRGAARALGVGGVTSPTFNIVHEYGCVPSLYHFDAYRLADGEALLDVGFDEYLCQKAFILLEWAELVEDALPKERINVTIVGCGDMPRSVRIQAVGARFERMVDGLCRSLP